MKKRHVLLSAVTGVIVITGAGFWATGTNPIKFAKQKAASAVVKMNDADLSPPAEFQASTSEKRDKGAKEELGYIIGTQAYLYGAAAQRFEDFRYGIGQLSQLASRFNPGRFNTGANDGISFNELAFIQELPKPDLKLGVTPNVDTLYGSVFFDLEKEPVVLSVPEIEERYYSLQIVDHNLANVGYIAGHRDDWRGGDYLFTAPGWQGAIPEGVRHFPMPTNEGQAAIRILIDGPEDEENVQKLQQQFAVATLSRYLDPSLPLDNKAIPKPNNDGELHEFRRVVETAQKNPPLTPQERAIWATFEHIGMSLNYPFDPANIDPAIRRGMERAVKATQDIVAWNVKYRGYKSKTLWNVDLVGGSYGADFLKRAEGAIQGYIVHDPIENMYFHTYHDQNGDVLNGSNSYILHFDKDNLPPVNAFWSVTVYGTDYNIVANPINRYAIGDRTKGLKYGDDGSLTIHLSATEPAEGKANWLPIPDGRDYRLNLRMYNPREVMLNADTLEAYLPPVQIR